MSHEIPVPEDPKIKEVALKEIAYVWNDEVRNQKYKELVGEHPSASLSEEAVAHGILHPEQERARLLARNREEDRNDHPFARNE